MNKRISALIILLLMALVAIALVMYWPKQFTTAEDLMLSDSVMVWPKGDDITRGRIAAIAADCAGCHISSNGEEFAGGLPFHIMGGTIYASNITPDNQTGIGSWTLDDFRHALVDGIDNNGIYLYPAMPFDNYHLMAERDITSIYAYIMKEVAAVSNDIPDADMPFPFSQRWGIRAWKWAAMPRSVFIAQSDDPVITRGQYLVDVLGHCGACHTARTRLSFAQKGFNATDKNYLLGGELDGWSAPALRGENSVVKHWSDQEITKFLQTGRNAFSGITGEMTLVVKHSLQYMPESDIDAMVQYLRILSPYSEPDKLADNTTKALLSDANPTMPLGARLYLDNCGACHFVDGKGADNIFPEIDGNAIVTADSADGLIDIILNGAQLPSTQKAPYKVTMPGFADRLSNEEVAELATFVRQGWSNSASKVSAQSVNKRRDKINASSQN